MINIYNLLKAHAANGELLYSTCYGIVAFHSLCPNGKIRVSDPEDSYKIYDFTEFGQLLPSGECLLFPSITQRDWNKYVEERKNETFKVGDYVKFDGHQYKIIGAPVATLCGEVGQFRLMPLVTNFGDNSVKISVGENTHINSFDYDEMRPYDKVLVRQNTNDRWLTALFCGMREGCVETEADLWPHFMPYNDETAGYANTTKEAPNFYKMII
jgi:hypothetical protein